MPAGAASAGPMQRLQAKLCSRRPSGPSSMATRWLWPCSPNVPGQAWMVPSASFHTDAQTACLCLTYPLRMRLLPVNDLVSHMHECNGGGGSNCTTASLKLYMHLHNAAQFSHSQHGCTSCGLSCTTAHCNMNELTGCHAPATAGIMLICSCCPLLHQCLSVHDMESRVCMP